MILIKSVLYRIFASVITAFIAFVFTGNLQLSFGIGIFEFISKIFAYYLYEKLWNKLIEIVKIKQYRNSCYKFNKNGIVILVTGLNCSGKTTIAKELTNYIKNSILLDGDAIRNSINYDLSFSDNDIKTNLTKVSKLANLLTDQGYNVIISCIAKNKNNRQFIKEILKTNNYFEVYTFCDEKTLLKRQKLLHKNTKVIQTNYEESEYNIIKIDTTKNLKDNIKKILCLISKD